MARGHQIIGTLPGRAYTSWARHVGALIVHQILYLVLTGILGLGGGVIVALAGGSSSLEGVVQAIASLVVLAYGLWNWGYRQGATGSSVGKSVLKFRVVDEVDGELIGFGRSVVHELAHFLYAVIFGVGYLLPLFTAKRQTTADMVMGTVCLPIRKPT